VSVTSSKPFEAVVAALEAIVGRPNMAEFRKEVASATSFGEVQQTIQRALGDLRVYGVHPFRSWIAHSTGKRTSKA
jgi:hypothetical protein